MKFLINDVQIFVDPANENGENASLRIRADLDTLFLDMAVPGNNDIKSIVLSESQALMLRDALNTVIKNKLLK